MSGARVAEESVDVERGHSARRRGDGARVVGLYGPWPLGASADPAGTGVITGRLVECDLVLAVVVPGYRAPTSTPLSVILVHRRVAYALQAISFPTKPPWVGEFSFTVPDGRYEVISTYQGYIRWVDVRSGSSADVTLGSLLCPGDPSLSDVSSRRSRGRAGPLELSRRTGEGWRAGSLPHRSAAAA
jgi:hypothetical protein